MKIGVISDTHGDVNKAKEAIAHMGEIQLLIHLGDHYDDGMKLKEKLHVPLVAIKGNCDSDPGAEAEIVKEIGSHKFLLVHGHQYGVKVDLNRLYYRAMELGCDVALYGHTHVPISITYGNLLILNPGSPSLPRGGSKASYGLVEIQEDEVRGFIIEL